MPKPEATQGATDARCQLSPLPDACPPAGSDAVCADPLDPPFADRTPTDGTEPLCAAPPRPESCEVFSREELCDRSLAEDVFMPSSAGFSSLMAQLRTLPFEGRIECISRRFLRIPYKLDPLGEGPAAQVDRDPLFRFDRLDCMTYIEQVMALALSSSYPDFLRTLNQIRYRGGLILYGARKHFVEADWLPENERQGYLRDMTQFLGGRHVQHLALTIDRARWILHKQDLAPWKKSEAIAELKRFSIEKPERAVVPYLPIDGFFADAKDTAEPNAKLFAKLPEISILLMIRKPPQARKVGVIVEHMGLLLVPTNPDGTRGTPILRHATPRSRAIIDEPFLPYLAQRRKHSAGVRILAFTNPEGDAAKGLCGP
jgi:N-acetylmuramoyl-L-alanine amidase-like